MAGKQFTSLIRHEYAAMRNMADEMLTLELRGDDTRLAEAQTGFPRQLAYADPAPALDHSVDNGEHRLFFRAFTHSLSPGTEHHNHRLIGSFPP
ncbi:hypothetical protein KY084_04920 [Stakelama sp. CBK3Z-3]|uniref:Uncharacterized protein n=1 Tax=Stakelama flava TaxID=2860338 RepID=A0ABS6XJ43_9SPHN|nr:hypothetical protein [Stakelama flava]MBW4330215.1 hypothetical protein [Stakelama flava]